MTHPASARPIDLRGAPADLLRRWPNDRPLVCLTSGGQNHQARWSILASPAAILRCPPNATDPIALLDDILTRNRRPSIPTPVPFNGGCIGWLSYDLGRIIEPSARASRHRAAADDRAWPLFEIFECPAAYVHDGARDQWFIAGDEGVLPRIDEHHRSQPEPRLSDPRVGSFISRTGRHAFEGSVARAVEYIRAGDIFQANLAHRLSAPFEGSPRELAYRLLASADAPYGAYIECPDETAGIHRAIISVSPELFLEFDPNSRRVVTRPIKGTRAAVAGAETDLQHSCKDEAELTMIVDLMRNDLGRVCEFASIRVEDPRRIERHSELGVVHGVATVSGTVRHGISATDLLAATFPPGSVTGAPKIRAMQIIDALEPVRRGPYCGAIGFVSHSGHAAWNVAIRTAALTCEPGGTAARARGILDYSVGAGIVADSEPAREWAETLDKARVLRLIGAVPRGDCP